MIDLTSITLDEFLCVPNLTVTGSVIDQFGMMESLFREYVGGPFHDLGGGYFLHRLGDLVSDIAVTYQGQLVGFYKNQVVAVDPAHGQKGLGSTMVLAAMKYRNLPSHRILSPEGLATLKKAWRIANGQVSPTLKIDGLM